MNVPGYFDWQNAILVSPLPHVPGDTTSFPSTSIRWNSLIVSTGFLERKFCTACVNEFIKRISNKVIEVYSCILFCQHNYQLTLYISTSSYSGLRVIAGVWRREAGLQILSPFPPYYKVDGFLHLSHTGHLRLLYSVSQQYSILKRIWFSLSSLDIGREEITCTHSHSV